MILYLSMYMLYEDAELALGNTPAHTQHQVCIVYIQLLLYVKLYNMNEIGKAMHALEASCSEEQLALVSNLLLAMMPNDETTREMIVVRFMEVVEGLGS